MKRLIAFLLLPLLVSGSAQVINTGNHRQVFPSAPSASPCAASITGAAGDYWAGSYSASPLTTNWTDSSSFGNAMSPQASPTWANNTFGAGLAGVTLNGTSQYFQAATKVFPGVATNFAGYAIVNMPSGGGGSLTGSRGTNGTLSWQIRQGTSNNLELDEQGTVALCTTSQTFNAGTTYEVAVTWDGTNCNFYVNNSNVFTTTHAGFSSNGMDTMMAAGTTVNSWFNGSVYEVAFSSSATYQSSIHTCWAALGLP